MVLARKKNYDYEEERKSKIVLCKFGKSSALVELSHTRTEIQNSFFQNRVTIEYPPKHAYCQEKS